MEFKQLISRFVYRIESKPGGGFIATCKDPNAPAIEGATREEVQQKIQASIQAQVAAQFPNLAPALQGNDLTLHYHIDPKPGGGYIIHHGDPAQAAAEGSTREHLENMIESKLLSALIERLPPELHQQITKKINSGGLDLTVDRRVGAGGKSLQITSPQISLNESVSMDGTKPSAATSSGIESTPAGYGTVDSSPVTYEKSDTARRFFRLLLFVGILALLTFLFFRYR